MVRLPWYRRNRRSRRTPLAFTPLQNIGGHPLHLHSVIDETYTHDPNDLEPPLELHISAPTHIHGSNNRIQIPGPRSQSNHLANIMKLSINTAQPFTTGDQDFDDEENEKMGRGPCG
ncbi:MAG: hypothetical protein Q9183_003825, partial [Haloplaca sp. 2 TL-2023]